MTTVDRYAQARENAKRFRPKLGRSIQPSLVRLVIGVAMVLLCFAIIGVQWALVLGLFLAMATLVFPRSPAVWALGALLAILSLGPIGTPPTWKFFVALAAVHLLHAVGMTLSWLPVGGAIELRVLGRILRPFVIIQIPAQLVSFVVLTLLAGRSVAQTLTSPFFGLVAGGAFVLLVVVVLVPVVGAKRGQ